MALMTPAQHTKAATILANRLYTQRKRGVLDVQFTMPDLEAAVASYDAGLESPISSHLGTDSIAVALNKGLVDPFKTQANIDEKSELAIATNEVKYGSV